MAELAVEFTFPAAPITSLQKRISKGIEQLYYSKLFLTSPAYARGEVWRRWHDMGLHVAIFSPPPGTAAGDRVRVRVRAPSRTPLVSVSGDNLDALKDLESLLATIDASRAGTAAAGGANRSAALEDGELGRVLVQPLRERLEGLGLEPSEIEDFESMLLRAFTALTDHEITKVDVSLH